MELYTEYMYVCMYISFKNVRISCGGLCRGIYAGMDDFFLWPC